MIKSGYLLINKPKDWTSFDVVKKTKKILKPKKIGHIGTLDPFATGLLVLLINDATKLSQYLINLDKEYIVTGKFGEMTDTGDCTGTIIQSVYSSSAGVLEKSDSSKCTSKVISRDEFTQKIPEILAIKKQVPSKYSAIKINGQRAYKLARAGKEFEMTEREIEIKEFELLDYNFPYFTYRTVVSKGTYVRTLTEQIAVLFDYIAVTTELQRTKVGVFDVKDAIPMGEVTAEVKIKSILAPNGERSSVFGIHASEDEKNTLKIENRKPKTAPPKPTRPVITIGTFDGVHRGHQYLLKETVKKAKELQAEAIVITYHRHPLETINKKVYPYILTEPKKREDLILGTGIDKVKYLNFDKTMSQLTPEAFLKDILLSEFNPRLIVVGYDTHFGVNRSGNKEFLAEQARLSFERLSTSPVQGVEGRGRGFKSVFEVIALPPLKIDYITPSSSMIRNLIATGDIAAANMYLGRYYSIIGEVVHGDEVGRSLGYPTINLQPSEKNKLLPQNGVYFSLVEIKKKKYKGVTNIGFRPTLSAEKCLIIETHLLDFSDEVYGEILEVFFVEKIRDEEKFESVEKLVKQIKNDVRYVNSYNI